MTGMVNRLHHQDLLLNLLQPENVLVDAKGNIKVSDFGLSALPQNQRVCRPLCCQINLNHFVCA
jgi:serine/threonine protein kinase